MKAKFDPRHPIAVAIYVNGGVASVAPAMGISQQLLTRFRARGFIPLNHAHKFCTVTGAKVADVLAPNDLKTVRQLASLLNG